MSEADPAAEGSDGHPADDIDEIVHQRHRLGVMVVLAEARRADFSYLKSVLELTDGNLGRHLKVLERSRPGQDRQGLRGGPPADVGDADPSRPAGARPRARLDAAPDRAGPQHLTTSSWKAAVQRRRASPTIERTPAISSSACSTRRADRPASAWAVTAALIDRLAVRRHRAPTRRRRASTPTRQSPRTAKLDRHSVRRRRCPRVRPAHASSPRRYPRICVRPTSPISSWGGGPVTAIPAARHTAIVHQQVWITIPIASEHGLGVVGLRGHMQQERPRCVRASCGGRLTRC